MGGKHPRRPSAGSACIDQGGRWRNWPETARADDRALHLATPLGGLDVYRGEADFSAADVELNASRTGESLVGFNRQPDWSPDGRFLAYVSSRAVRGRDVTAIAIQSTDSGKVVRQLQLPLTYFEFPLWTPDGESLIGYGWDLKGSAALFRVNAQTGTTTKLTDGDLHGPQMSHDGRKIYSTKRGSGMAIVELDVTSGIQQEIFRGGDLSNPALSPDGRVLAVRTNDPETRSSRLLVIQVASDRVSELAKLREPESLTGNVSWTPDGNGVIVRKIQSGRPPEFQIIGLEGRSPRRLAVSVSAVVAPPFRLHPDGRRVLFTAGESKWEIDALENFLPVQGAKR